VIISDIENEAILGTSAFVLDRLEVSARKLSHPASPVTEILKKHFFRDQQLIKGVDEIKILNL